MPEAFFIFFLAIAIIAITALLFGGWAVVTLLKFVFRGIAALGGAGQSHQLPSSEKTCGNPACAASNPTTARFCRRCGQPMPGVQRTQMKRVAMW